MLPVNLPWIVWCCCSAALGSLTKRFRRGENECSDEDDDDGDVDFEDEIISEEEDDDDDDDGDEHYEPPCRCRPAVPEERMEASLQWFESN